MEKFKVSACAPPSCSCPTLSIDENIDGDDIVTIVDDYSGVVVMSLKEFNSLCNKFVGSPYYVAE